MFLYGTKNELMEHYEKSFPKTVVGSAKTKNAIGSYTSDKKFDNKGIFKLHLKWDWIDVFSIEQDNPHQIQFIIDETHAQKKFFKM